MSVLAHYFEEEGLATTGISLVREHSEALRPPRALWVPFELGRPLGVPGDAAFQRRVLLAVLKLLEAEQGPLLEDYPEDAPAAIDGSDEGWTCPIPLPRRADGEQSGLAETLQEEVARLTPWHELATRDRGRNLVRLSGLEPAQAAGFIAAFLEDEPPQPYRDDVSAGKAFKLACEDMKAFYLEAATAQPGAGSSSQLTDWFWGETTAGQVLLALQPVLAGSKDKSLAVMATNFLVPRSQAHRLA